jgi:hypothetical protein
MMKLRLAIAAAAVAASLAVAAPAMADGKSPVRKNCGPAYDHAHIHWVVTGNGSVQKIGGPNFFIPAGHGPHRAANGPGAVHHQFGVYCEVP